MRRIIKLTDHPSNDDPTARLVDGRNCTRDYTANVYSVKGGYIASLPGCSCFEGLFASVNEALEAQTEYLNKGN